MSRPNQPKSGSPPKRPTTAQGPAETRRLSVSPCAEIAEKLNKSLQGGYRLIDVPIALADDLASEFREVGWAVEVQESQTAPLNQATLHFTVPEGTE